MYNMTIDTDVLSASFCPPTLAGHFYVMPE